MTTGAPTFATPPSFLGLSRTDPDAAFVVAGIPLDIGTTNRAGARSGPAAIRAASRMLVDGAHPHWWIDPAQGDVSDAGDFAIALGDLPASLDLIAAQAARCRHLLALGGEHGITLPLLRALRGRHDRPLGLLVFDAHVDTWPDSFGQRWGHGSVFFHAINEALVDPARMVQIGIRSPVPRGVWDWTQAQGVTILTAQQVHQDGIAAVLSHTCGVLGAAPAYLSFDIDALDPSCAPGTGTPELGGLHAWQAQALLRGLDGVAFVGMDVVEVSPPHDVSEITSLAAATVAWEYLALQMQKQRSPGP